jgi:hypothetical protein
MSAYLDASRPAPYCPGCGHPHVLRALDEALGQAAIPRERLAIVTDIGCVGLADPFFPDLHTVHTLHGRSVAVAVGLALGDRGEARGPLVPIVLIGDGGAGIGLLHLVHAAQLNAEVKVLVHNNLIYGMTGGQHSLLTPPGMKTATTPGGCPVPPLDLGGVIAAAGGGFYARVVAPGGEVAATILAAIRHPGFAVVEIMELCPTFASSVGGITGKDLKGIPASRGLSLGIVRQDASRPPLREALGLGRRPSRPAAPLAEIGLEPEPAWRHLDRIARVVIAGRAGERVQSAALLAAQAAMAAGLHATVRTDNPVTQGTGFSLAEIAFAPEPIGYIGPASPDLIIVLSPEGQREIAARGLWGATAGAGSTVVDASIGPPEGGGAQQRDLRGRYGAKGAAIGALVEEIEARGWWDRRGWEAAIRLQPRDRRAELEAVLARAVETPARQ